jgi:histone H3/H4
MAVKNWSAEAIAELRSLEQTVPRTVASRLRSTAQEIAAAAGRSQVERLDVCRALGRLYGMEELEEEEAEQEA